MLQLVHNINPNEATTLHDLDDNHLMSLVCNQRQEAFTELVARYEPRINRYLSRMVGEADNEDLCQEVFLELWRTKERYREQGRFKYFLYRIARNKAINHSRWKKVRTLFAKHNHAEQPAQTVPLDGLDRVLAVEQRYILCKILQGIPKKLREPLVLHHGEGLPYATIAKLTGVAESTLRVRCHRALALLRQRLHDRKGEL